MLVEIAIADAYGAPFEFAPKEYIEKHNKLARYYPSYREKWTNTKLLGQYTDDTQMSIAIGEHMLAEAPVTQESFVRYFQRAYQRDPIGGYSKRIRGALESKTFKQFLVSNGSFTSNGCVMRTVPLGLLADQDDVIFQTVSHVAASHASPKAIDSSCMISLSAHYLYHRLGPKADLVSWLSERLGRYRVASVMQSWTKSPVQCDAAQTAAASIKCVVASDSMAQILKGAIAFGGDTDSTASVSIGLASLSEEITNDLPNHLYDNHKNEEFGINYLSELDKKLFNKFKRSETIILE